MSPLLANNSSHAQDAVYYAPESISSLVIFILVFIIGIPGNGLVIWVAGLKMKRSVNIIWFLNLAVADFMCCLSLPFVIVHLFLNAHWPYGWFLCKVIPSVIIFTMFASVFLLMVISIDRCLLVMKPVWCQNHRTVKFISLVCSGIWILAFIICCPVFHYRTIVTNGGKIECGYDFRDYETPEYMYDGDSASVLSEYYSPSVPTVTYVSTIFAHQPTDTYSDFQANSISTNKGIITAAHLSHATVDVNSLLNSSAYPDIRLLESQSDQPNTSLPVPSNNDFNSKQLDPRLDLYDFDSVFSNNDYAVSLPLTVMTITRAVFGFILPFSIVAVCYAFIAFRMRASNYRKPQTKMLKTIILVVAAFFICWAPYHAVGILSLVATPGTELKESLILWDHLSVALAYANSCINPLLYVFVGRDFRAKARQSLQGVLERVFTEEPTCSTPYSLDKSKTSKDKDASTTV
ncbi:hypothetical protein CIB84_014366 [Bambusicola thoracicus]|uniref:C3a anaphylatoxin chemotactic receptor n=1 Tax=Bambusicola thoracicus TaxID=9083 RepID=A0A2P4SCR0_BAMTH|nr:hypothetical protein CIB84_014366 [Bambusicola thoracicus]